MILIIFAPLVLLFDLTSSVPIYPVPLTYVALSPLPENIYNQVQDTKSGEYAFGYAGGPVAREEAKTSDGVTRGAYSYVDAHGIVQYHRYIADDNGFRVVGTNIPTDVAVVPELQTRHDQLEVSTIEAIDDKDLPEKSRQIASSRKKRGAIYDHILVKTVNTLPVAPPTVVADASVPAATSSQIRVQVHESLKGEIHNPIEGLPIETVVGAPETPVAVPVAVKSIESIPVAVAASVPTSTSSQSRFQIHNSLSTELHESVHAVPIETVAALQENSVAVPVAAKSIEAIPVAVAASVPTSTSSQSRFQIHNSLSTELHESVHAVPIETVAALQENPVAAKSIEAIPVAVAASVPTSTSSQSRFQIHNSLRTELHEPVHAVPIETVAALQENPVAAKSIEAIPVAVAASVPTSTSSQSRFQIHNSLSTELHETVHAAPIETVAAVQENPVAVPVAAKSIEAIPVAVAASVPTSTSSQSRFQIHNSLRTELHEPVEAVPIATVAAVQETPFAVPVVAKNIEATPVAIAPSVATSTSSQSRLQIHNGVRTELHEPVQAVPIETVAEVPENPDAVPLAVKRLVAPATPIAIVASVPTSTSSQQRHQIHDGSETLTREPINAIPVSVETAIADRASSIAASSVDTKSIAAIPSTAAIAVPAFVTTSRSNEEHYPVQNTVNFEGLPHSSGYELVGFQPEIVLQPANAFSLPLLAQHRIGVGLGVVPSPYVAYHNYVGALFAES